jgi:hypothetical protein
MILMVYGGNSILRRDDLILRFDFKVAEISFKCSWPINRQ